MGHAAAYDFKVFALTLGIIGMALVAAAFFGGQPAPKEPSSGPKLKLGG